MIVTKATLIANEPKQIQLTSLLMIKQPNFRVSLILAFKIGKLYIKTNYKITDFSV
jgi:hypothetical protein